MVVKEAALHDVQTLQRLQALDHLCPHGYVAGKWILCCAGCSVVSDSATPWTVAHQARLSMGFSRQEHWSGLSFPFPGNPPKPGIKPGSPALQADSLLSQPLGKLRLL